MLKVLYLKNCFCHSFRKRLPFSVDEMAACCILEEDESSECLLLQVRRQVFV